LRLGFGGTDDARDVLLDALRSLERTPAEDGEPPSSLVPFEEHGAERFLERAQAAGDGSLIHTQAARCGSQGLLACEDDQDPEVVPVHGNWLSRHPRSNSLQSRTGGDQGKPSPPTDEDSDSDE
jgi:hypothetical protein